MKEKLNNQSAGNLYENIPIALKNENEVGKKNISLITNECAITRFYRVFQKDRYGKISPLLQ